MNLFSILLLLIIFSIFFCHTLKKRFIYFFIIGIFLDVANFQGYFIKISGKEISYRDFYSFFFLVYLAFILLTKKINEKLFFLPLMFIVIGSLSIAQHFFFELNFKLINSDSVGGWDSYVAGYTTKQFLNMNFARILLIYFRLLEFSFMYVFINTYLKKDDYLFVLNKSYALFLIILSYSVFEFVSKNIFNTGLTNEINNLIFGSSNNTYDFGDMRNGYFILQGFSREPSHLSYALFYLLILVHYKSLNVKKSVLYWVILAIIFLMMYFSGSFSSNVYYLCFAMLVFLFPKKQFFIKSFFVKIFVAITLFCIFLLGIIIIIDNNYSSYNIDRLNSALNYMNFIIDDEWKGRIPAESTLIRIISIVEVLKNLLHNPLIGIGCGIQWAHSGVVTLLSCVGILGFTIWVLIFIRNTSYGIKTYFLPSFMLLFFLIILPNLFCGFVENMFSVSSLFLFYFAQYTLQVKR